MVYDIGDYNDDGALKVTPLMWLIMAYLSRHLLLLALSGFSTFMMSRRGFANIAFADFSGSPVFLLASLPAVVLFSAALLRSPASRSFVRTIWRNGRWFLAGAALIDLLLALQAWSVQPSLINEWRIAFALLDIYILLYALLSRRLGDLFADFPDARKN